jgi:gas vesicle protein
LEQEEFGADDLLEDAHPLWVDLDPDMKRELRAHTETIIREYQRKGLDEHIQKVQAGSKDEWRVVSKSLQALQRKVGEFVDDVQIKLEQTKLTDDWDTDKSSE